MGFGDKVKNLLFEESKTEGVKAVEYLDPIAGRVGAYISPGRNDFPANCDRSISVIDAASLLSVDEIYKTSGLTDKETSIYKVNEIKATLPSTMTKDQVKATTIAMMGVAKLTTENLVDDAERRKEALLQGLEQFTVESKSIVADAQSEIAEYESKIEALKEKITTRNANQEKVSNEITAELEIIQAAEDFIQA